MIFCWDVIFEPVKQDDEGKEIQRREFQYDQKSEIYFLQVKGIMQGSES